MSRINLPSIQAETRRRHMRSVQAKTLANAHRHGCVWDDEEVAQLVNDIRRDETTFDMAMRLGRSYYSVQGARAHVRFAMDHIDVIKPRGRRK